MPQPTRSQLHQSVPLQNLTVAALQDEKNFIGASVAPIVPVVHRADKYYKYDTGSLNRIDMKPRGPADESVGSGYTLSTDSYSCEEEAVHKDLDWGDMDDADDQVNPDQDAAIYLAQQAKMRYDQKVSSACFGTSIWTTDWAGVSAGPSTNQILQWNSSSSDPQADIESAKAQVFSLIFRNPNTLVVGRSVHKRLITNEIVRQAIKYTDPTLVNVVEGKLADFFGVDKYIVGNSAYNTAKEGQTASQDFLFPKLDAWLGYVAPTPGKRVISAAYTFAWKGGPSFGSATDGIIAYKYDIPQRRATRAEVSLNVAVKVVSADAGAYLYQAVAS